MRGGGKRYFTTMSLALDTVNLAMDLLDGIKVTTEHLEVCRRAVIDSLLFDPVGKRNFKLDKQALENCNYSFADLTNSALRLNIYPLTPGVAITAQSLIFVQRFYTKYELGEKVTESALSLLRSLVVLSALRDPVMSDRSHHTFQQRKEIATALNMLGVGFASPAAYRAFMKQVMK